VLLLAFVGCSSFETKTIETEYGDKFSIIYDDYMHKWSINDNSRFHLTFKHDITEADFVGIWNTPELKSYILADGIIIFRRADSEGDKGVDEGFDEGFKKFDGNFSENEDMIPVVRSVLFRNSYLLETYLPYFFEKFPTETQKALQNFTEKEYELLSEYGLTSDVISDTDTINYMSEKVKEFWRSN
jgi:hypothetical protein